MAAAKQLAKSAQNSAYTNININCNEIFQLMNGRSMKMDPPKSLSLQNTYPVFSNFPLEIRRMIYQHAYSYKSKIIHILPLFTTCVHISCEAEKSMKGEHEYRMGYNQNGYWGARHENCGKSLHERISLAYQKQKQGEPPAIAPCLAMMLTNRQMLVKSPSSSNICS